METPLSFAGNPLDRASAERPGEAWVAARRMVGRFLPFWQMKPLVVDGRAAFLPWAADWEGRTTVFLGLEGGASAPAGATKNGASAPAGATKNGASAPAGATKDDVPLFAVDLGAAEPAPAVAGQFHDMRAAAMLLPARDTAIAGQAKALLDWHARHGFCPNCGHATASRDGGYRRLCPNCGAEHFPRTDPVVIMLPIFKNGSGGEECLVGRNARFANGLFSAFAGFVEPGESLEEAVRRELREEVAVTVGAVRYHRSQPWPFPSSLMLGCYAQALSKDFTIDGTEIAEARWINKDQARQWLKDEVMDEMRIPPAIAIAHHLVKDWVEG